MPTADKIEVKTWYGELEEPFIVPTPCPYVVEGARLSQERKDKLIEKASWLWRIIHLLNIEPAEAHRREFSLNDYTTRELEHKALFESKYDIVDLIREHLGR